MTSGSGRLAWLALTPEELKIMAMAVQAALATRPSPVYESLDAKVRAQARSRFASVRLTGDEVNAMGPAYKSVLDELKTWTGDGDVSPLHQVILDAYPELGTQPERAALLRQKVHALRVKTGLQKGWTRGTEHLGIDD